MTETEKIYKTPLPVILAPMAGVTDLPFRLLCREQGCDVTVTEMVSAKALYYGNRNTLPLMQIGEKEHPVGIQLFGSEPALMADMARQVAEQGYDFIDLNMGCPVPKIVNNHEGSALMKDPALAGRIVREVSRAVSLPVTVKIRAGFDAQHKNAVEFALHMEDCGAAALAVHARTREQYYSGEADREIIRQVKEKLSVPVIGNGDIKDGQSARSMLSGTGCDGIMIGRAARGNPWIFREVKAALSGEPAPASPAPREILKMLLLHTRLNLRYKGEYTGIREMRKHAAWYTAGLPGSARFRERVNHITDYESMEKLVLTLTKQWN